MIEYQLKSTGNVRILYQEMIGWPLCWESSLSELKQYVEKSPVLNLAAEQAHFIFYVLPTDIPLEKMDSAMGLEVLGHELFSLESDYQLLDLDRGECYGLKKLIPLDRLTPSNILSSAQKMAQELTQEGTQLAPTWRILWNRDKTPRYIDIQFFTEL